MIKHSNGYILILILLISSCKKDIDNNPEENNNPFLIKPGSKTLVVAHRGGKGLMPENTLVAFDNAVAMNVNVLEMDLVMTKDSILVACHDLTIDDTSDSTGNIADYTYAELQQFNFGYQFQDANNNFPYRSNPVRIPRIEDILNRYKTRYLMIEIKDVGARGNTAMEKLMNFIVSNNMSKHAIIFSFDDYVMDYFHSNNIQNLLGGASLSEGLNLLSAVTSNPDTTINLRSKLFAIPMEIAGSDLSSDTIISAIHRSNAAVHYWTINNKDEMKTLIQKGADGIITDYPDRLQEALTELGF